MELMKGNILNKNYHIFPFGYKGDIGLVKQEILAANSDAKSPDQELWREKKLTGDRLYQFVSRQVNPDSICAHFVAGTHEDVRKKIGISPLGNEEVVLISKNIGIGKFLVRNVEVFLFDMNVGFLVLQISLEDEHENIDEYVDFLINFNNNFKKFIFSGIKICSVNHSIIESGNGCLYSNNQRIKSNEDFLIRAKDWLVNILPIKGVEFFNEAGSDTAYPFVNIAMNYEVERDIARHWVFKLRHSYSSKYAINWEDERNNAEVFQPFENMHWGIASEGACGVHWYREGDPNEEFIKAFYNDGSGLEKNYLTLIIIVLFWKYSSIVMTDSLQKQYIDKGIKGLDVENMDLDQIYKLKQEFMQFRMKSYFTDASRDTHINRFFKTLIRVHGIDGIMDDTDSVLSNLEYMASIIRTKQDEALQLEERKRIEEEERQEALILKDMQRAESLKEKEDGERKWRTDLMIATLAIFFAVLQTLGAIPGISTTFEGVFGVGLSGLFWVGPILCKGYTILFTGVISIVVIIILIYLRWSFKRNVKRIRK